MSLSRRQLLKVLGGGILVAAVMPETIRAAAFQQGRRGSAVPQEIAAWVHVGTDGKVTIFTGKVEVGQNARTSLTQAAAEELRVSPKDVAVVMGDTDLTPFDMGTFGSRTTPTMVPQVRKAAAQAREMLTERAAQQWQAPASSLKADGGMVVGAGHSASYGELAAGKAFDGKIDPNVHLTPSSDWRVLGKSEPKVAAAEIVTGSHLYSIDLRREGMLHGVVLRAPSFGATLLTLDPSAAEKLDGVKVVHEGDFVAVAAPTQRRAVKALDLVKSTWKETATGSSDDQNRILRGSIVGSNPPEPTKATYTCAYIAHVPLEPRAALAEWDGTKLTVHTGSQRPFGVQQELVEALGLKASQVRVIVPDTGSGYGGKHSGDAAVEAARIAKALNRTVKVVWSRQEEFTWAYFRPGGVVDIVGQVSPDGHLLSWKHDNFNSGPPGIDTPYDVP
ncbi:MAG TPA: molybdopterin cofactor-binding domain-containing protein, partial [Fimbriimonas sp.]|nr:molybdopterin cofactor-binding domain-containing protein [Fimbriimonas sp.]